MLKFKAWLQESIDPHILGLFRIAFGLFMVYEMIVYFQIGLIKNMFVLPAINFQYDFFRWLKPMPETWLNILLALMLICSILMLLGVFFKWSCRIFALGYAYFLLLDKSIFNNHIYLFILIALLLSFTDAHRTLSILPKSKRVDNIPRWQQFILQLQIMIVYFYGGFAKLKFDWLMNCQPVRYLTEQLPEGGFLTRFAQGEAGIYFLTYGGLFIDLAAPVLLWCKPLRKWAIYIFIIFHSLNALIFPDIGIFPFIMLVSLILFYETSEIPGLNKLWNNKKQKGVRSGPPLESNPDKPRPYLAQILIVYFIFQLAFPLRGYFLPNDMDWTSIGNRFSWRMKVNAKEIDDITFTVYEIGRDLKHQVDLRKYVNDMQILNMAMDPRSVVDFGRMLKGIAAGMGVSDVQILTSLKVRYNGRPSQYFIEPGIDVGNETYSPFQRLDYVVPLHD
jgi:hypothetical protein